MSKLKLFTMHSSKMDERTIAISDRAGHISFWVFLGLSFLQYISNVFGLPRFDRYLEIGINQETLIAVFSLLFYYFLKAWMGVSVESECGALVARKKRIPYVFIICIPVQLFMCFLFMQTEGNRQLKMTTGEVFAVFMVGSILVTWILYRVTVYLERRSYERYQNELAED